MTDTLQNNLTTVAPDGTIGAEFTGVVDALGLTIPEGAGGAPGPQNKIVWNEPAGQTPETILGLANGSLHQLSLDTTDPGGSGQKAQLLLEEDPANDSNTAVVAFATGSSRFNNRTLLIDSLGESRFLQLLSEQQLQLAFGFANFIYPGGTNQSNPLVVNHNIGRLPGLILGLPNGVFGAGQAPSVSNSASTITTATFVLTLPVGVNPAPGGFGNLFWAAAG